MYTGCKHGIAASQLHQFFLRYFGDAGHCRQAHDADSGVGQGVAGVGHQSAGDEAAGQGLVVHQPDDAVTQVAGQVDAFSKMGHVAVDAQHFVAVAQALALRVDQQHNGAAGMVTHRRQHGLGLRQGNLHADRRMAGGTDDVDGLAVDARGAIQELFMFDDVMSAGEQGVG